MRHRLQSISRMHLNIKIYQVAILSNIKDEILLGHFGHVAVLTNDSAFLFIFLDS